MNLPTSGRVFISGPALDLAQAAALPLRLPGPVTAVLIPPAGSAWVTSHPGPIDKARWVKLP